MDRKYTIVQHSGVTTGHDEFAKGLESKGLAPNQLAKVTAAGGLIFDDYTAAEDYAEKESYPEGHQGMIPCAPGRFSKVAIDGLRIYVPAEKHGKVDVVTRRDLRAEMVEAGQAGEAEIDA